jgi:pimeloyl-ACP methyl ester carboxylesterase
MLSFIKEMKIFSKNWKIWGFLLIAILLLVNIYPKDQAICKETSDKILMNKNAKVALLIHGYPEPIYESSPLYQYFQKQGYSIVAPYLFSSEFRLTPQEVKKYVERKLDGQKPDVIVGVSLGGLLAPNIAQDYPNAKLVMVATGPYIRTEIGPYNRILEFVGRTHTFTPLYWVLRSTPTWFYSLVYKTFNHSKLNPDERQKLETHIKENWSCVTAIPKGEDEEVIDFVTNVDNTMILRSLKNPTIIFAGDGDIMMPSRLSGELKELIKNSDLVLGNNKEHWNVFDESNWKDLDSFLGK